MSFSKLTFSDAVLDLNHCLLSRIHLQLFLRLIFGIYLMADKVANSVESFLNQFFFKVEVPTKGFSLHREFLDAWGASIFNNFSHIGAVHLLAKLDFSLRPRCVINVDERIKFFCL